MDKTLPTDDSKVIDENTITITQEDTQKFCADSEKMIMKLPGTMVTPQCCTDKTNNILKRIFDIGSDQVST